MAPGDELEDDVADKSGLEKSVVLSVGTDCLLNQS